MISKLPWWNWKSQGDLDQQAGPLQVAPHGVPAGRCARTHTVTLPVATTAVTITHLITAAGQTEPLVEVVLAVDGAVSLPVGETPLSVEGDTMPRPRFADFDC